MWSPVARSEGTRARRASAGGDCGASNHSGVSVTIGGVPATAVETLKVSARSNPNSVAGAIAGAIRTSGAVFIQVVGAGALNQATKASVIARGILSTGGLDIVVTPSFADIEIDGEARTALRLRLEDRERRRVGPDDPSLPQPAPPTGAPTPW